MENHSQFIKGMLLDIVGKVEQHYEFISYVNQHSNKESAERGQWVSKYYGTNEQKQHSLIGNIIRVVDLQNEHIPIRTSYYHVQVHKQYVPNLCGYHATYNLISAVQAIKFNIPPQFDNAASFWSYVYRTQQFLTQYRDKYRLCATQWPWRDDDLQNGDFERSYLKVCLQSKPLFKSTFKNETIRNINYIVTHDNLFFQYGNIVNGFEERKELQKKFTFFVNFKPTPQDELIQTYMLGVTNHWIGFIAYKSIKGTQFVVMDSRNRDYFEWNEVQMREFLANESIERQKRGQHIFNQFYLDLYTQCMKDIQQLNCLMVSWLSGQSLLEAYVTNQKMKVFLNPLVELLEISHQDFLKLEFAGHKQDEIYQVICLWIDQYKHTIYEFFGQPVQNIDQSTRKLFLKTQQLLTQAQDYQIKHKLVPNYKSNHLHSIINSFTKISSRL